MLKNIIFTILSLSIAFTFSSLSWGENTEHNSVSLERGEALDDVIKKALGYDESLHGTYNLPGGYTLRNTDAVDIFVDKNTDMFIDIAREFNVRLQKIAGSGEYWIPYRASNGNEEMDVLNDLLSKLKNEGVYYTLANGAIVNLSVIFNSNRYAVFLTNEGGNRTLLRGNAALNVLGTALEKHKSQINVASSDSSRCVKIVN